MKYEAGVRYYEKKDYRRAAILFEEVSPILRGLPEGEKGDFYLAYCRYYRKAYFTASELFRLFYETYGRSELAMEARYMYAYSLYIYSPPYNLDQNSSKKSMEAMQSFINQYPNSSFFDEANEIISQCHNKIERKNYENAKFYLKLKKYKAAVVSFQSFEKNFPDSRHVEEVLFLRTEAQFKLAEKSLTHLKKQRFDFFVKFYKELLANYPASQYLKQAKKYYTASMTKMKKLI